MGNKYSAGRSLHAGRVTVWRVALDIEPERLSEYEAILNANEHQRAERFRFRRDRRRFIASHYALRRILSGYLDLPAEQICFAVGPCGKPVLDGTTIVHFNLSHAHELALIAVAKCEVGVDLEYRGVVANHEIAALCCTPRELQAAVRLPVGALAYWTCKEAYVKGTGTGLSVSPAQIELSPPPIDMTYTRVVSDPAWSIYPFVPAPGYHAAVAIHGGDWLVDSCDWSW